jgi:hypothetical protein
MADKKRMGTMSLSSFGKTSSAGKEETATPPIEPTQKTELVQKAKPGKKATAKPPGKTATLNIQVTRAQQRWLQNTAQAIRDRNDGPVPGPQRVYPVHLIQAAIDLLRTQDIEWDKIKDVEELKDVLNI